MAAKTGSAHHYAKLSPKLVREMRDRYAQGGITYLDLACEYDVAASTAAQAVKGVTWRDVGQPPVAHCPHCSGTGRVRR